MPYSEFLKIVAPVAHPERTTKVALVNLMP